MNISYPPTPDWLVKDINEALAFLTDQFIELEKTDYDEAAVCSMISIFDEKHDLCYTSPRTSVRYTLYDISSIYFLMKDYNKSFIAHQVFAIVWLFFLQRLINGWNKYSYSDLYKDCLSNLPEYTSKAKPRYKKFINRPLLRYIDDNKSNDIIHDHLNQYIEGTMTDPFGPFIYQFFDIIQYYYHYEESQFQSFIDWIGKYYEDYCSTNLNSFLIYTKNKIPTTSDKLLIWGSCIAWCDLFEHSLFSDDNVKMYKIGKPLFDIVDNGWGNIKFNWPSSSHVAIPKNLKYRFIFYRNWLELRIITSIDEKTNKTRELWIHVYEWMRVDLKYSSPLGTKHKYLFMAYVMNIDLGVVDQETNDFVIAYHPYLKPLKFIQSRLEKFKLDDDAIALHNKRLDFEKIFQNIKD